MNVKWKFALLTVAVCALSLLSFVTLWLFQKSEANAAAIKKGEEAALRIEKLLALKSGIYRKQANDYAYWNDLVKYVGTKDARWAKDNLDGSLNEFGSNGVYVLETDKTVIYSSVDRAFLNDLYKVVDKESLKVNEPSELHFYAKTKEGIVEFFGSPIQHSTQRSKDEKPYGYFLVAKHWSSKYIEELEKLGDVKISFEERQDIRKKESDYRIYKHIPLKDIHGKQIAQLYISIENDLLRAVDEYAKDTIKLVLIHIAIIIGAFIFLMSKYFTLPLINITRAIKQRSIEPIKEYLHKRNEYGNISRAINDAFKSRAKLKEINRELEQRVQEEVEKNRQKDRLLFQQSKNAALGELVSLIAHQWRQPLNAVGIIMQSAYYNYKRGELTEEDMEQCNKKGMELINSMSKTIDAFRNFFLPNKEKELFRVETAIDSSVELVFTPFAQLNIRVEKHYEGKHDIFGYKNDFEQTILNLLLNARDAIVGNDVKEGVITITVRSDGERLYIDVADNGGGIADNLIDKIFDPYISTKHQSQGVGIGLYMAKQIIEKHHNGDIRAANNEQNGATITIRLL